MRKPYRSSKVQQYGEGRVCANKGCKRVLSRYNSLPHCNNCNIALSMGVSVEYLIKKAP